MENSLEDQPLINGTRLQTDQKRHDCCPALPVERHNLDKFCHCCAWKSPILHPWGCCVDSVMRNSYATRTQHACCVTTQRCILQYSVPAGCKKVELCLEGWLSRKCVGEGAKYRKLQRCAAAQHAMLHGCCVHVAYDETHAVNSGQSFKGFKLPK